MAKEHILNFEIASLCGPRFGSHHTLRHRSNSLTHCVVLPLLQTIGYNQDWEHKLAKALSHMEHAHLSTLVYVVQ